MNDPELNAMEKIHEAMAPLSAADQKRIARWTMPVSNVEVKAQSAIVAALDPLNQPQRQRVVQWARNRFSGPVSTKASPPKAKDRTIDLRAPGAAA